MSRSIITSIRTVDSSNPQAEVIRQAASMIRAGRLVAFPTETVYGLGANALDSQAVERIFEAKGRPATNPVIVHVAEARDVTRVAADWPEVAETLAAHFWPGPLTLVLRRQELVPAIVTAGGPTVAVRCPAHPVAAALIREAGVPIAAPSANRSTELSPTRAEHVLRSLNGRIDLLLDGGPCSGGIESTVVDVTGEFPRILRPGLLDAAMLEAIVGRVEMGGKSGAVERSPGQMARHYSPRTPVRLADSNEAGRGMWNREPRVAWLALGPEELATVAMPTRPEAYASRLYEELHRLDDGQFDAIVVTLPPDEPAWFAIRDRLKRAAVKADS